MNVSLTEAELVALLKLLEERKLSERSHSPKPLSLAEASAYIKLKCELELMNLIPGTRG